MSVAVSQDMSNTYSQVVVGYDFSSSGTAALSRAIALAARAPVHVHTTRRGTLKFRWADAGGTWDDTEVKDVTRIEIAQ